MLFFEGSHRGLQLVINRLFLLGELQVSLPDLVVASLDFSQLPLLGFFDLFELLIELLFKLELLLRVLIVDVADRSLLLEESQLEILGILRVTLEDLFDLAQVLFGDLMAKELVNLLCAVRFVLLSQCLLHFIHLFPTRLDLCFKSCHFTSHFLLLDHQLVVKLGQLLPQLFGLAAILGKFVLFNPAILINQCSVFGLFGSLELGYRLKFALNLPALSVDSLDLQIHLILVLEQLVALPSQSLHIRLIIPLRLV